MAIFSQFVTVITNCYRWRPDGGEIYANQFLSGASGTTFYTSAARFTSVSIIKNTIINSATLSFEPVGVSGAPVLIVKGNDIDTSPSLVDLADANARVRTAASAAATSWSAGVMKDIDVKTIVEEITTRAGWATGGDMMFFLEDNGSSYSDISRTSNVSTTNSVKLVIDYGVTRANNIMIF